MLTGVYVVKGSIQCPLEVRFEHEKKGCGCEHHHKIQKYQVCPYNENKGVKDLCTSL